ncbi:MAG: transcription antitermination factor NusB [Smithellaceae bacterium]|nr:transcription antitermination factor NusB [Smithellaceae bacterium]
MMHQRRKAREVALQVLYKLDIVDIDVEEALTLFWQNFEATDEAKEFSSFLVRGAWEKRGEIDDLISGCSENWSISRMSKVDKSILRLSVFELLYCPDVPPKVTLNEAIELGKTFGSENSGAFINGILDALYARLRDGKTLEETT